ncbi:Arabinogalactan peptide 3 [Dendrobium catenatum]|uniref:Arabinogalactan peptide 3 n=1 Tax=Dendrobium catenatum TaxID=906689 RepID=A0A2I0X3M6_9ASPA|nr:Arabinogalactan peptide 3 [Dendrobium catenatum]
MAAAQTGVVSFVAIAVLAVALLSGSASAVDAPAPSPASGGNSLSSPVAGVFICSVLALMMGFLRH